MCFNTFTKNQEEGRFNLRVYRGTQHSPLNRVHWRPTFRLLQ